MDTFHTLQILTSHSGRFFFLRQLLIAIKPATADSDDQAAATLMDRTGSVDAETGDLSLLWYVGVVLFFRALADRGLLCGANDRLLINILPDL